MTKPKVCVSWSTCLFVCLFCTCLFLHLLNVCAFLLSSASSSFVCLLAPSWALIVMMCYYTSTATFSDFHSDHWLFLWLFQWHLGDILGTSSISSIGKYWRSILGFLLSERTSGVSPFIFSLQVRMQFFRQYWWAFSAQTSMRVWTRGEAVGSANRWS